MGLFRQHPPIEDPELSREMRLRLEALAAANERHDKIVKELRLEWDEWYDKFRLLYARAAKRIKDAAQAEENGSQSLQSRQDALQAHRDQSVGYGRHPPLHERANPTRRNY